MESCYKIEFIYVLINIGSWYLCCYNKIINNLNLYIYIYIYIVAEISISTYFRHYIYIYIYVSLSVCVCVSVFISLSHCVCLCLYNFSIKNQSLAGHSESTVGYSFPVLFLFPILILIVFISPAGKFTGYNSKPYPVVRIQLPSSGE